MKNIFSITALCAACAMLLASCTKSADEQSLEMKDNEGVLSVNIATSSRADIASDDTFVMRIYKYSAATEGEREKALVRKYKALAEVPQYIWLLEGDYCVSVQVGDKVDASFDKKYFEGAKDFSITPRKIETVDVDCAMQNASVAADFDATIAAKFTKGYSTYVCAIDSFNLDAAKAGSVPTLKFESNATGYFLMPDGCTTLCWSFSGEDGEGNTVTQSGKIADVKARMLYTLRFKYSKDAGGFFNVTATVDTTEEHCEDKIPFSPDPVVKGDGFDAAEPYNYVSGERKYIITALDNITEMKFTVGSEQIDLLSGTHTGIAVSEVNKKEYHVTLSDDFFATLSSGTNELQFRIKDASGGIGLTTVTYGIQGVATLTKYDLWNNTADFTATVFGSPADVQIGYRIANGEWSKFAASTTGAANTYAVQATGFAAGKTYEYALFVGSVQTGKVLTITTPAGAQIPNADMEQWFLYNDAIWCPCSSIASMYWDTGNHATAGLLGIDNNLTYGSDDVRPGSTGTKSGYMHSIKASVMGIGKFAAGNLFVGKFVRVKGTNGIVDFGRAFTFTARPKALQFWMKNNCGEINMGKQATGLDPANIYVCLCNRTTPYTVDTSDTSTLFNPETADGVLAYGIYKSTESHADWTLMRIDLTYKDEHTVPNFLVLTFTCSAYGDYFTGSTSSWMSVDDVEFVY